MFVEHDVSVSRHVQVERIRDDTHCVPAGKKLFSPQFLKLVHQFPVMSTKVTTLNLYGKVVT